MNFHLVAPPKTAVVTSYDPKTKKLTSIKSADPLDRRARFLWDLGIWNPGILDLGSGSWSWDLGLGPRFLNPKDL